MSGCKQNCMNNRSQYPQTYHDPQAVVLLALVAMGSFTFTSNYYLLISRPHHLAASSRTILKESNINANICKNAIVNKDQHQEQEQYRCQ